MTKTDYILQLLGPMIPFILIVVVVSFCLSMALLFFCQRFGRWHGFFIGLLLCPMTAVIFLALPIGKYSQTLSFRPAAFLSLGVLFLYPGLLIALNAVISSSIRQVWVRYGLLFGLSLLIAIPSPLWWLTMGCAVYGECL